MIPTTTRMRFGSSRITVVVLLLVLLAMASFQKESTGLQKQPPQPKQQPNAAEPAPPTPAPIAWPPSPPTIAYMSQGPTSSYERLWGLFQDMEQVQFYYHTFDKPCTIPEDWQQGHNNTNKPVCLFRTKTTFAQGRHILLRRALQDEGRLNITYYVFFDDDTQILCGEALRNSGRSERIEVDPTIDLQCWKEYTQVLLSTTDNWPFLKPGDMRLDVEERFTIRYQTCVDASFQATHRDYNWLQYPASHKYLNHSWYTKDLARWVISQRCFKLLWRVDNHFAVTNRWHRPYPRQPPGTYLTQYMEETYGPLGPWNAETLKQYPKKEHRCEVSETPPSIFVQDQLCNDTLHERYNLWLEGKFEPDTQHDETAIES